MLPITTDPFAMPLSRIVNSKHENSSQLGHSIVSVSQSLERSETGNMNNQLESINKTKGKCNSECGINGDIYNVIPYIGQYVCLYEVKEVDITGKPYVDIISSRLELENVRFNEKKLLFFWDEKNNTPKGFHSHNHEYKYFKEHNALRHIRNAISMPLWSKDEDEGRTIDFADNFPEFPLGCYFTIDIDEENKTGQIGMSQSPLVSTHIKECVCCGPLGNLIVTIHSEKKLNLNRILHCGMDSIVFSSPKHRYRSDFISTAYLSDCIAVIFYNETTIEVTFCHYFTQLLNRELLDIQLSKILRSNSSDKIKAFVVGGYKGNIGASNGFFSSILSFIKDNKIDPYEFNVGSNRPSDIIFNVLTGELFGMEIRAPFYSPITSISNINESEAILIYEKSGYKVYFSTDNDEKSIIYASVES